MQIHVSGTYLTSYNMVRSIAINVHLKPAHLSQYPEQIMALPFVGKKIQNRLCHPPPHPHAQPISSWTSHLDHVTRSPAHPFSPSTSRHHPRIGRLFSPSPEQLRQFPAWFTLILSRPSSACSPHGNQSNYVMYTPGHPECIHCSQDKHKDSRKTDSSSFTPHLSIPLPFSFSLSPSFSTLSAAPRTRPSHTRIFQPFFLDLPLSTTRPLRSRVPLWVCPSFPLHLVDSYSSYTSSPGIISVRTSSLPSLSRLNSPSYMFLVARGSRS